MATADWTCCWLWSRVLHSASLVQAGIRLLRPQLARRLFHSRRALRQAFCSCCHGRLWLLGVVLFFGLGFAARFIVDPMRRGAFFAAAGAAGLVYLCLQGLAVGFSGWTWGSAKPFSDSFRRATLHGGRCRHHGDRLSCLMFAFGLVERGVMKGDAFVVGSISLLVFLVFVFVFYPIGSMLVAAVQDFDGSFKPDDFIRNMQDPGIWSLSCLVGDGRCGVAWRTFTLAIMTASASTLLGLPSR